MAIAPPFTLTLLTSQPISRFTAQACAAKASLISSTSRSCGFHPARCSALVDAATGPMPMIAGSRPTVAKLAMRPNGFRPSCAAFLAVMTITAAAPSFRPDALPAVTPPALSKAGRKAARPSALLLRLMNSSLSKTSGSPFFCGMLTATISSLNLPASCAAAALVWLPSASSSCDARLISNFLATFSAVMPMWYWLYTSQRPSTIMVSTSFQSPMRWPLRELGSTCGAMLMFS